MLGYTMMMHTFQEEGILRMKTAYSYKEKRSTCNIDLVMNTLELGDL